ncbi:helix-turn-helix domain-containing protein [Paenibacillus sp. HB172176]|uniref:helix-turn-helix domain-containing protein n=1 Tax=Paenibacillus sp. HB172176 TaxID=2493690 RepID=UPI00143B8073|nr:helix-turn-helix domain-containing protein [Paenibacillus sp. HB172176]
MTRTQEDQAVQDMLLHMQVQIMAAHLTQCRSNWRDIDYTPAYNKLYFILNGEGWVKIGDTELYPKPGQLILLPAGVNQSYSTISDEPFLKYWCHFTAETGQTDVFQWLDVPSCYELDTARMTQLFKEMAEAHTESTIAARLREKSALLQILAEMMTDQPLHIQQEQSHDMERLTSIQQYVEQHLHTEVTLEDMAATLHLHPNYFSKYFKRHFGVSPLKYVSRKKMDHAKHLLRTTSQSVKEIALATGFEDANYFSKTFRREAGLSPSEYRMNIISGV